MKSPDDEANRVPAKSMPVSKQSTVNFDQGEADRGSGFSQGDGDGFVVMINEQPEGTVTP